MTTPVTKVNIAYSGLGTNIGDTILVNYNLAFGVPEFATTEVVEQGAPETPLTHVIETGGFLRVTQNGSTPASGTFVFTITVPSDEFVRSILNGNIFKEETLKDLFTQLMLLTGEVREGRLGVFQQDLDMGAFNIVNMADGVDPTDAVNKGQLDAILGEQQALLDQTETARDTTLGYRDDAAASKAAAEASAIAAAASALAAATSATNAAAHEQGALDALTAAGLPTDLTGLSGKGLVVSPTEDSYISLDILDEDDMVSDRDDATVTQQSVKAYVDSRRVGQLVQMVEQTVSTPSQITRSSATYLDDTVMTLGITPQFADSTIEVSMQFTGGMQNPASPSRAQFRIVRVSDTTELVSAVGKGHTGQDSRWPFNLVGTDTPNTTSSVSYRLQLRRIDTVGTAIRFAGATNGTTKIIIKEIAA